MAATAYPHIIFATGPDVITKELLHEVLAEAYPHGTVSDAPLKSVLQLGEYAFTFWFDDEADGLAQRYAGYLPEGARRRRLVTCTTMIDFSGGADPEQAHRDDAERIVAELAELDGVWVFSEASKRFVAFDYGPPPVPVQTMPEPADPSVQVASEVPAAVHIDEAVTPDMPPTPALEPAEVIEPAAPEPEPEPAITDQAIEPAVESGWSPTSTPEQPTPPQPTLEQAAPAKPAADADADADEQEKSRFFKRVFQRKNP